MSDYRRRLGLWGENKAAEFLKNSGYSILERNFHCSLGEIDLIATKDGVWIFIEVKTRSNTDYGLPEESITQAKASRLMELARHYLYEHGIENVDWRVDIVAVELDSRKRLQRVEHLENAISGW